MAFSFETHVLPLLQEMAANPLDDFSLPQRVEQLGLAESPQEVTRFLDLLLESGYVTFTGQKESGGTYVRVRNARLTTKALEQLNLWPADNERGLYLLSRLADAFEAAAAQLDDQGEAATAGKLRRTGRTLKEGLRDVSTDVTAKVVSNLITGGL